MKNEKSYGPYGFPLLNGSNILNGKRGLQDFMTASGVPASNFYGENAFSKKTNHGRSILLSFDRQAQLQERLMK